MTATDLEHDLDSPDTTPRSLVGYGWFLVVTAGVALACSLILIVEKIHMIEDKLEGNSGDLGCDINPFVSCGGVFIHPESEVFGFPNPLMGIVGFAIVLAIGVLLAAGGSIPRWWWAGLQVGVLFGIGFVTWLQSQSIYDFEILCPYCMVVWSMMIPMFVVTTGQVLRQCAPGAALTRVVNDWRVLIIGLWIIAIVSAIWFQFGEDLWA